MTNAFPPPDLEDRRKTNRRRMPPEVRELLDTLTAVPPPPFFLTLFCVRCETQLRFKERARDPAATIYTCEGCHGTTVRIGVLLSDGTQLVAVPRRVLTTAVRVLAGQFLPEPPGAPV